MSGEVMYQGQFGSKSGSLASLPVWYVTTSSENNATEGTYTYPGGTQQYDPAGCISNSGGGTSRFSSGVVFKAPITGYYQFNYIINVKEVPLMGGYLRAGIFTTNDEFISNTGTDAWEEAGDFWSWTITCVAHMNITDQASPGYINNGGATTMDTYSTTGDGFSGHFICPGSKRT